MSVYYTVSQCIVTTASIVLHMLVLF